MADKANKLIFANSEKARDAITASQQKEIAKLYEDWAKDLGERAKYYKNKATSSSYLSERQAKELQKALTEQSRQVSNEVHKKIKQNIYTVSDAVVKDNVEWLKSLGFSGVGLDAAYSSVPDSTVRMLVTGQIYEGGWNLSGRIWSSNEKTLSNCYRIVATGIAENKPIYNIAKELEKYVSPQTAKGWNPILRTRNTKTGEWEYKHIYRGKVDYNAQRLARTLVQHGYQQSFIAVTEKNPFVLKYQWSANGSRVCPICQDRDGQIFEKGDLPMDHPNGMCTMIPITDDQMLDKLADWFNSPDGTYPEIDEFAKNFGYTPNTTNVPARSASTLPVPNNTSTMDRTLQASSFKGGSGDFEITKDVNDLYLTSETKKRVAELTAKINTAEDFEKYLANKGIKVSTTSEALKERWSETIKPVKEQIDYIISAVEQYNDLGGLSGVKAIHFWDVDLDVQAQYVYRAIGEGIVSDEGHIYISNRANGFQVMHEFAHAYADSTKPVGFDVVTWSEELNRRAGLSKEATTYFGAASDVVEAEKFADAIGGALAYGKEEKLDFVAKVSNIVRGVNR